MFSQLIAARRRIYSSWVLAGLIALGGSPAVSQTSATEAPARATLIMRER